jgi:hypothetical protein
VQGEAFIGFGWLVTLLGWCGALLAPSAASNVEISLARSYSRITVHSHRQSIDRRNISASLEVS